MLVCIYELEHKKKMSFLPSKCLFNAPTEVQFLQSLFTFSSALLPSQQIQGLLQSRTLSTSRQFLSHTSNFLQFFTVVSSLQPQVCLIPLKFGLVAYFRSISSVSMTSRGLFRHLAGFRYVLLALELEYKSIYQGMSIQFFVLLGRFV